MRLPSNLGQLTYCTNIHAGESLADIRASLALHLPGIKRRVSRDAPMGVGLRLGAQAVSELQAPGALQEFQAFLRSGSYYVFTLNGFPYGPFHGQSVKSGAYRPDWSDSRRLSYTNDLADILASLLPPGQPGTISTVPATFKPWADDRLDLVAEHLIDHVAHLVALKEKTGCIISLALEPEPHCYLETIAETVEFFNDVLFSSEALVRLAAATGLAGDVVEETMRQHIGICYDVCHAAVEFENPADSIRLLRAEGIAIGKLQLSSALKIARLDAAAVENIRAYDEPVYLHQVVQRHRNQLSRFVDLPEALTQAKQSYGAEWRVHFHVPIFLQSLPHFDTTQDVLRDILKLHREQPISDQLEVETYTWDVLPANLRDDDIGSAIARELEWVISQLTASGQESR